MYFEKKNVKTIQNRVKKIDLNSTIFQPSSEAQSPTSTDCPWVSEDEYSCMLLIVIHLDQCGMKKFVLPRVF